ncbi:hypothetical protein BJY21_000833 [Kineosphaera limosa]|uniref:Uncharacterized protein n=1 Tax=Kineosphaera limosa NBRC 100340 TaxID=1184609 RepID=K6VHC1_9MICO|nr:hypothetical protein [Kineosphaera limosa]NYD99648.1 hypothetical protein [Kineosphaera limosa]GAB95603.1 hypothetical protein KILIM_024_00130 [Kineosphaera limosa NBRC 100340]
MKVNPWRTAVVRAVGLAGVAGLVAGGVVIARNERRRRAMTPDEIHERLRQRYAQAQQRAPQ